MNLLSTILLYLLVISSSFANSIEGVVKDVEGPLLGATVVVLDPIDSTMVAFGITDENGKFLIYDIAEGDQLLQISYTGYSDYSQIHHLIDGKNDLGTIVMSISTNILQEVSIKAEHIPMGILGDTINYNASAFKTRPGASVEDLLKKMPGIEVARDGSIKAQGEDVNSVLVDGKEFFSGDPTMATKNLEAEAVDKVQVFDKKSEEAEFTGVDDGQEEKTINLKLKEDYKTGGFGNVSLDAGIEGTKQGKLSYNRFSPTYQASIIGNVNNINEQAFSFNDYIQFMGGLGNVLGAGGFNGGAFTSNGGIIEGINDQYSLGSNLNIDFTDKIDFNSNYLHTYSDNLLYRTSNAINFTDANSFSTIDTLNSITTANKHRINTHTKFKINPHNHITLKANGVLLNGTLDELSNTKYFNESTLNNSLLNDLNQNSSTLQGTVKLNFRKKFSIKGRSWISSANYQSARQDEETNFDNSSRFGSAETRLLQQQNLDMDQSDVTISTKFTEPLTKGLYLGANYSFRNESQSPKRRFFNQVGMESLLDTDLSDEFTRGWITNNAGFSLRRNSKKLKLNLGLRGTIAALNTSYEYGEKEESFYAKYILPSLSIDWDLKRSRKLDVSYNTKVTAPSLNQIITIPNNQNPNFIIAGNPDLVPEFVHSFDIGFSSFDQFNFSNLFGNASISLSDNKIVNARNILDNFVQEVMPINASSYLNATAYLNHGRPIRKLGVKFNTTLTLVYDRYKTQLNEFNNEVSTRNLDLDFRLENRNKDLVDIGAGVRWSVSDYQSSFNLGDESLFYNYSLYSDGYWNITDHLNIGYTYDLRTFNSTFNSDGEVQHLLGATISQNIWKDQLAMKFTAHDILNQNSGLSRSGGASSLVDSRFNTLGRYVMLGLSYRIGKVRESGISIDM